MAKISMRLIERESVDGVDIPARRAFMQNVGSVIETEWILSDEEIEKIKGGARCIKVTSLGENPPLTRVSVGMVDDEGSLLMNEVGESVSYEGGEFNGHAWNVATKERKKLFITLGKLNRLIAKADDLGLGAEYIESIENDKCNVWQKINQNTKQLRNLVRDEKSESVLGRIFRTLP